MTRTERQELAERRWEEAGHRGTFEGFTGFGKTNIAKKAIARLRRNDRTRTVIIVVPKEALKVQWESILSDAGMMSYTRVFVINSLINLTVPIECDLLIPDEIHRYASDSFRKLFDVVRARFILGLTARLKRLDSKEGVIREFAPIFDRVTMAEGRANGWTAPLTEYNLSLMMNATETREYDEMFDDYQRLLSKFKQDFGLMKECGGKLYPIVTTGEVIMYSSPPAVLLAKEYGWNGNTARMAHSIMEQNRQLPPRQRTRIWGGDPNHPYRPEMIQLWAINCMRRIHQIRKFIFQFVRKVDTAVQLVQLMNKPTIVFCEVTSVCDKIAERLGDNAVVYHTNIKAKGKAKKEALKKAIDDLLNGRKRFGISAKALDEGVDWPEAELGVDVNRTSNPLQHIQRRGRPGRKHELADGTQKQATYVNIYLKHPNLQKKTLDEKWLSKAQEKGKGQTIMWVDSIEEILEAEAERVD